MSFPGWMSLTRHVSFLCSVALLAALHAGAQSATSVKQSPLAFSSSAESSSSAGELFAENSGSAAPSLHGAFPALAGAAAGQPAQQHRLFTMSNLAFEVGGGFNAPIGNDRPYITYGGNLNVDGGFHLTNRLSLLGEFGFMDNKLPGAFIAAAGQGATGGNTHILSLTAEPVLDFFPGHTNSFYAIGGGGYYHKSTNFTVETCCDFYGYPISIDTNSFASNQGGLNLGLGYTHHLGGLMGDSRMKLFGEVRYLYLFTPPTTQTNGLGRTELLPVTFGLRW